MFVSEDLRFPYLTGRLLESSTGKSTNSYNSGVSGNNSLHSLTILLSKVFPLQPDMVFMMHNVNDLNILLYEGDYWNKNRYRSQIVTVWRKMGIEKPSTITSIKRLVQSIFPHLYNRLHNIRSVFSNKNDSENQLDEFSHLRGEKLQYDFQKCAEKFKMNLVLFIQMVRSIKSVPILMTQANRLTENPDSIVVAKNSRFGRFRYIV
jgi:hypothetical protein